MSLRGQGFRISVRSASIPELTLKFWRRIIDLLLSRGGSPQGTSPSNFSLYLLAIGGIKKFLDYIRSLPHYHTAVDRSGSSGISISYKKSITLSSQ
jgi:hypothetical protein